MNSPNLWNRIKPLLAVGVIPAAEFILLREVTNIHFNFNYINLVPAVFMIIFSVYLVKEQLAFGLQKMILGLNLLFLAAYIFFIRETGSLDSASKPLAWQLAFYGLVLSVLGSSLFIFIPVKHYLKNIFGFPPAKIIAGIVVGASLILYGYINHHLWGIFSRITTASVTAALRMLGYPMIDDPNPIIIRHPTFGAQVGSPCSGLEGVFFFIAVYTFLLMVENERVSKLKMAVVYGSGMIFMYFLNIFRITIFFMAGLWAQQRWESEEASKFFISLFHSHIGWILYSVGIALFIAVFSLIERALQKK